MCARRTLLKQMGYRQFLNPSDITALPNLPTLRLTKAILKTNSDGLVKSIFTPTA
jgi:hypothetical protein